MNQRSTGPLYLAEMWHRLSLDAPTVALVWSIFLARAAKVQLPYYSPLLLALGTWIVYVADRILDGLREPPPQTLRERHFFYARHRLLFAVMLGCATAVCGTLVITRMRRDIFDGYAALGVLVLLYFFLIHGMKRSAERWLPKEFFVGVLFAAATALPVWMRMTVRVYEWEIGVSLFAVLCWLNCVAIESWEDRGARSEEQLSPPHASTRWLGEHLAGMALALVLASSLCVIAAGAALRPIALACGLSASFILLLHWQRMNVGVLWLRVAVDVSLLSPVLLLPWMVTLS